MNSFFLLNTSSGCFWTKIIENDLIAEDIELNTNYLKRKLQQLFVPS